MEQNTTSVVIEQQGENKKRGALAVILAVAFVAMLGIGSTFAYMTWTGNQTPNRFTVDKGLTADVVEPAWTDALAGTVAGYPNVASDGDTTIPADANNFNGVDNVTKISKDPYVVNTSMVGNEKDQKGSNAYVGIRLTFQKWVASSIEGVGKDHKETGKYVTMSTDEVKAFFTCYMLNTSGTETAATDTDGNIIEQSYGISLGDGWAQYADGTKTSTISPTMYFVYNKGITSVGEEITGDYPAAQTTAAADKSTTTNLFNYVQLMNSGDALDTFIGLLKSDSGEDVNATSDPGFRILVDTAAVGCGTDTSVAPSGDRINDLSTDAHYPTINTEGGSPTANPYWTGKAAQGSGYGTNATNVPESYWKY
jgi:hypothetical protein